MLIFVGALVTATLGAITAYDMHPLVADTNLASYALPHDLIDRVASLQKAVKALTVRLVLGSRVHNHLSINSMHEWQCYYRGGGGGSTSRLGGRELTLLCGFNQYTLLQNRDYSGLLGTSLYCSLKLGGGAMPPNTQVGGAAAPPAPPVEPPLNYL